MRRLSAWKRRTLASAALLCLLWAGLSGGAASGQQINLPPVTRTQFENGMRIVLMEYHRAPTLTVRATFPGGSALDPADKAGLAAFTAALLTKGTETHTAPQISEEIDFLGGSLGAGASRDRFSVSLDVLSKDTAAGLALFTEALRHPTFPAEEVERVRQLSVAGLESIGDSPGAIANRVAAETVFAGHPYGLEPTVTSVKSLQRSDLIDCYKRLIAPNRMTLVVVGDFKAVEMLATLKKLFADWPKSEAPAMSVSPVKPSVRRRVLIDKPDATQTQVRWTRVGFPRSSDDYYAAQIANTILGSGFTSRLIDEIRVNRSLTYGIGSSFAAQQAGGSFGVSTFTKIETTRALLDATEAVLRKTAQQGVTAAELQKVKGLLVGLYAVQVQTPEALAGQLTDIELFGLPKDYLRSYLPRLRAITLEDANRIAKTYFAPENLSVVLVGPAKKIAPQLQGLGAFETHPVETVGK